jgi:uncharacterized protein
MKSTSNVAHESEEFIYVLRLVERLSSPGNWTERDNEAVRSHFAHLEGLYGDGKVLLAGRTRNLDASTFGIVIFRARDLEAALQFMRTDPAVQANIMTAELFPFSIALGRTVEQLKGR